MSENGIDKLVDDNGNFIQRALSYLENFLEPNMDTKTMQDNYLFIAVPNLFTRKFLGY